MTPDKIAQFDTFVYWAFLALISGCGVGVVTILKWIWTELKQLNDRMIVIIERVNYHEERISRLERNEV